MHYKNFEKIVITGSKNVNGAEIEKNVNGNAKRAYSTYIQVGYDIFLPLDIVLGLKVGFTPWKGMYTNYEEVWTNGRTVGFNNLQLRAEREFELGKLYINHNVSRFRFDN